MQPARRPGGPTDTAAETVDNIVQSQQFYDRRGVAAARWLVGWKSVVSLGQALSLSLPPVFADSRRWSAHNVAAGGLRILNFDPPSHAHRKSTACHPTGSRFPVWAAMGSTPKI